MEDDMRYHDQARGDCLQALIDFPLLGAPSVSADGVFSSSLSSSSLSSPPTSYMELNTEIMNTILEKPGGTLTEEELRILLVLRRKTKATATATNTFINPSTNKNHILQSHLVSLGDLGRKDIRHQPGDAGTTKSFADAKDYFDKFDGIPYDIVTVREIRDTIP